MKIVFSSSTEIGFSQYAFFSGIAFLLVLLFSFSTQADELVVVVNPESGISRLSRDEVVNIYLGRSRQLASGLLAKPVDLPASLPDTARFYRLLVNKDLAEINSYWARLKFSGRVTPPQQAKSALKVLEFVGKTPGAIGYVNKSIVDDSVVSVFEPGSD